jgi:excisionase family DNA binding protein
VTPEYLTVPEVATALRVSRRTVERLIRAKRLRVVRPSPGRTMIEVRELAAYRAHLRDAA